jgi:hypothetical protein
MRGLLKIFFFLGIFSGMCAGAFAQDSLRAPIPDSSGAVLVTPANLQAAADTIPATDTAIRAAAPVPLLSLDSLRKVHSPRKAVFYSAVLPGLGQAYNHQYLKIPLMYAGLGVATGFFIYNFKNYVTYRDAYRLMLNGKPTGVPRIDQNAGYNAETVKYIRDVYRQYVDYSVIGFAAAYLYNIIDAIVFAHLYKFDVSNDLSWRIGPVLHRQDMYMGVGITFTFRK